MRDVLFICGGDNSVAGHAWVADGYKIDQHFAEEWIDTHWMGTVIRTRYNGIVPHGTTSYIWCNWGWGGGSDGYFVSGIFTPEINGTIYNFNHTLQIIPNLRKGQAPVVKPDNQITLSWAGPYSNVNAAYPVTSTVTVSCNSLDTMATFYGTLYPGQSSAQIDTGYSLYISGVSPSSDATYNYTY